MRPPHATTTHEAGSPSRTRGIPAAPLSESEYVAREREADHKSELVDGYVLAMTGASFAHNLVSANLLRHLGNRLAGGPCLVLGSDQRVAVAASQSHFYPDVTVVCGVRASTRRTTGPS